MKADVLQYCLRLPREVYVDAFDLAAVFGMSLNKFLLKAVTEYVESQLKHETARSAIAKAREARRAGLAPAGVDETGDRRG